MEVTPSVGFAKHFSDQRTETPFTRPGVGWESEDGAVRFETCELPLSVGLNVPRIGDDRRGFGVLVTLDGVKNDAGVPRLVVTRFQVASDIGGLLTAGLMRQIPFGDMADAACIEACRLAGFDIDARQARMLFAPYPPRSISKRVPYTEIAAAYDLAKARGESTSKAVAAVMGRRRDKAGLNAARQAISRAKRAGHIAA